jgi:lysozyme
VLGFRVGLIFIMATLFLAIIWFIIHRFFKRDRINNKSNLNKDMHLGVKVDNATVPEPTQKQVAGNNTNKLKFLITITSIQFAVIIFLCGIIFFYEKSVHNINENPSISSSEYVFGIDVSHYQGKIDWSEVRTSHHPIEFVFIRGTMGEKGIDRYFERNWENAKKYNYVRGAYHYYRPYENSTKQFENFKSNVKLEQGDFIPVLDIEKESKYGKENLREGVLNWLKLAENEYGVKPIIYTGLDFYKQVLKGYVDDYPLWIAAYSGKHRLKDVEWTFHQFTEKVRVKGINQTVDGNDFKGDLSELDKLRITNIKPN